MSKKTLYLLGILATILIGTYLYYKYCCSSCCQNEANKNSIPANNTVTMANYNALKINGSNFKYKCQDNFKFLSNGFNNIQPVSDSVNLGINQLKTYFDKNPNQKLIITGYALNSEKNTSAFPNLGIARANDIKNYFVSKGFNPSHFETLGELRDDLTTNKDTLVGPLDLNIKTIEIANQPSSKDWDNLKTKIQADPLILYFNTNQTEINLTKQEREKIALLSQYLDNVPNASINCIGHTDNVGSKEINIKLGQERANFAKSYLAKNGINNNRIQSSSKGPDEPIASNNSKEGKSKNRRTVITLK